MRKIIEYHKDELWSEPVFRFLIYFNLFFGSIYLAISFYIGRFL